MEGAWSVGRQGKRKGGQVRFTSAQSALLERRFAQAQYLSPEQRRALAEALGLSERQIKTWFQNRRAKCRRATPDATHHPHPQQPPPVHKEPEHTPDGAESWRSKCAREFSSQVKCEKIWTFHSFNFFYFI